MENRYLEKLHQEILNVMDAVVKVCEENGIKYYMVGGTLLGAVRHNGFIPWDDDLDIAMPRKDFERFIRICDEKIDCQYRLRWHTKNKRYWLPFAKVENINTVFLETDYRDLGQEFGIYIDIFPLDDVKSFNHRIENRKKIIGYMNAILRLKLDKHKYSGVKRLIVEIVPRSVLRYCITRLMTYSNEKQYGFYMNFGSQYSVKKQTIEKEKYGVGVPLSFEGRKYNAPMEYPEVLKSIYGNNYMDLPPVSKRKTHYPCYVKFSNGEEITFEEPKEIIRITNE